jgi:cell division septation protein DedD
VAKAAAEKAAAEEAPTAAAAAVKNQKAKPEQGQAAAQKQQVASDAAAFLAQLESLKAEADAPAIVQGMRAHRENAAVQQQGCVALWSLAINDQVTWQPDLGCVRSNEEAQGQRRRAERGV